MLPKGLGAVLFTGASASVKGYAQSAPFAMGKFALRGLAQSLARELAPARDPRRAFRHRRRDQESRARGAAGQAGFDARPRRHRGELPPHPSPAAQRLDLGDRAQALGGEVLSLSLTARATSPPDGVAPSRDFLRSLRRCHLRLEPPLQLPVLREIRRHPATRRPCEPASQAAPSAVVSRISAGRPARRECRQGAAWSSRTRPCRHRRAAPFRRRRPSSPSSSRRAGRASGRRPTSSAARASSAGPELRVRPKMRAARLGVPMRRAEPDEGRHEIDAPAPASASAASAPLCVGLADHLQAVAQPLHGRARDEDRAFERVGGAAVEPVGDGGEQPVLRAHDVGARC